MSKVAEIVFDDGEVLSSSEFGSILEFQFKILNSLDFETIKSFFIKKTIFYIFLRRRIINVHCAR